MPPLLPPDLGLPPSRPPPPPSPPPSDDVRTFVVHTVIVFAVSLLALFLCSYCKGYRSGQARAAANAAAERRRTQLEPRAGDGELQVRGGGATNTAARLPSFKYNQSVKHNVTGATEEAATCSVCLGAFQLGETVRLLPACLHLYHAECIDPWLDTHSTCPICRSDTDPTMAVGRPPPA